jgi:hypothetical protein
MKDTKLRGTLPFTCAVTKIEHQVADEDFAAERDDVRLKGLCGAVLVPQVSSLPSGRPCRDCRVAQARRAAPATPTRRPVDVDELYAREGIPRQRGTTTHHRPSALHRLLSRRAS